MMTARLAVPVLAISLLGSACVLPRTAIGVGAATAAIGTYFAMQSPHQVCNPNNPDGWAAADCQFLAQPAENSAVAATNLLGFGLLILGGAIMAAGAVGLAHESEAEATAPAAITADVAPLDAHTPAPIVADVEPEGHHEHPLAVQARLLAHEGYCAGARAVASRLASIDSILYGNLVDEDVAVAACVHESLAPPM